ncbi:hypothetical protein [Clostridium baratii]|uniref:hypothetical protein n=1 Tax=Clostridium baratii TaxID=1561 RepID=UPI0030D35476
MNKSFTDKLIKYKDLLTLFLAVFSCIFSFFALRYNYKDADLDIFLGEKITFSINSGSFQAIIPVIFTNNGSKPGIIYYSSIELKNINNPTDSYILVFNKIMNTSNATNSILDAVDVDKPIVVDKYSNLFYTLNFSIGENNKDLIPSPGLYDLIINAWTTPLSDGKPEISKHTLYNFSEDNYNFLLKNKFMTSFPENNPLKIPGKK